MAAAPSPLRERPPAGGCPGSAGPPAFGTTAVILHPEGAYAILGKCRCEPASVFRWFLEAGHRKPERFDALWPDFIIPRMRGCLDRCRDIESTYSDSGYRFPIPPGPLPSGPGLLAEALVREGERRIRLEGEGDGILEPCGNHLLLVDLRGAGSVVLLRSPLPGGDR